MLLNNLSKHATVINKLLPLENATENKNVEMIDNLLEIFMKGMALFDLIIHYFQF
jgi:hypothetical protein